MTVRVNNGGGMSRSEATAFKKSGERGRAADQRRHYNERIRKLDAELHQIKIEGRKRLARQHTDCGARYERAQATAREEISQARLKRNQQRETCAIEAAHVKTEAAAEARIHEQKLQAERDFKIEMRRIEATNASREKDRPKASGGERLAESNAEVEANLSPREIVVWRKIRPFIKGSGRQTRTEAFQKHIHDSGGLGAVEADLGLGGGPSDRDLAREREKHEAGGSRGRPEASTRRSRSPVPF